MTHDTWKEEFDKSFNSNVGWLPVNKDRLIAFIEKVEKEAYETGLKEWENVNKQYLSREEAFESGVQQERAKNKEIFDWLLGKTDFRERAEGEGAYWWRKELRERLTEEPNQPNV